MLFALIGLSVSARGDVFNLGAGLTNLDTVIVGDTGNASFFSAWYDDGGQMQMRDQGAVSYGYRIGKYEVTAAQYTDFLNQKARTDTYGLYHEAMSNQSLYGCNILRSGSSGSYTYSVAADWANRPVNFVSYWDACRFTNWLQNGQGDGNTENGAYTLDGLDGTSAIQRNAGARYYIPSEDEWYKAAYYKGGGTNAGYWRYPTQSNMFPSNQITNPDPGNRATFYDSYWGLTWAPGSAPGKFYMRTNVGEHENSQSPYGTYDQAGNVWEFVEQPGGYGCEMRGGSFYNPNPQQMDSILHMDGAIGYRTRAMLYGAGWWGYGFRIAAAIDAPGPAECVYAPGESFAGFTCVSTGSAPTTASLLAGSSQGGGQVSMTWREPIAGESVFGGILRLNGTGNDPFALAMTFGGGVSQPYVSWWNGSQWVNAVDGNTGNNAQAAQMGWSGSFSAFQSLYGTNLSAYMGAWGLDSGSHQVWAVLNHNSEFAVSGAVPEPSSLIVLGSGLMALGGVVRRRK